MTKFTYVLVAVFFAAVAVFTLLLVGFSFDPKARKEITLIVLKPDNIPIAIMLGIVAFYTIWGVTQAVRNDRLTGQGQKDKILKDMQR